ncbi:hypothetical protein [Sulfurimonas sp.]
MLNKSKPYKLLTSISFLLIFVSSLYCYELPNVNLNESNKTQIVVFKAVSVIKNNAKFYEISWETLHATDVMITFFGKVDTSGKVVVTKDEYERGPITLTATNKDGSFVVNETINKKNNLDPVVILKNSPEEQQRYYNPMPYRNYGRRYPRRRMYY